MADSGALRVKRARLHKAGDHSLCKRCPDSRRVTLRAVPAAKDATEPLTAMRDLAAQLSAAYRDDPGNALLARELRMTLQALMGGSRGRAVDDDLADLFSELGSA